MAETINIGEIAAKISKDIFMHFLWGWRYRHGEFCAVSVPPTLTAVQIVNPARLAVARHQCMDSRWHYQYASRL